MPNWCQLVTQGAKVLEMGSQGDLLGAILVPNWWITPPPCKNPLAGGGVIQMGVQFWEARGAKVASRLHGSTVYAESVRGAHTRAPFGREMYYYPHGGWGGFGPPRHPGGRWTLPGSARPVTPLWSHLGPRSARPEPPHRGGGVRATRDPPHIYLLYSDLFAFWI